MDRRSLMGLIPSIAASATLSPAFSSTSGLKDAITALLPAASAAFDSSSSEEGLRAARASFLGKDGLLTEILKGLGRSPSDERRDLGWLVNRAHVDIQSAFETRFAELSARPRSPIAEFPRIVETVSCTHTDISAMMDDVREYARGHQGTIVLSADNPESLTVGFSVFSSSPDATPEEKEGFLVRISMRDLRTSVHDLDPDVAALFRSQAGRCKLAASLMVPVSEAPAEDVS